MRAIKSVAMLLAAVAVLAQTGAATAASERLVLEPYPGPPAWQEVTNKQDGARFLRELIPEDQKVKTYKDILSAQSFPELAGQAPGPYLRALFQSAGRSCNSVRVNGPKEAVQNGVNVAYGQIYCGRQNGKKFGVQMFFKVMQGTEGLYVVQREFRVPPSEVAGVMSFPPGEETALIALMKGISTGNQYLVGSVYLCGGPSTDPRCAASAP